MAAINFGLAFPYLFLQLLFVRAQSDCRTIPTQGGTDQSEPCVFPFHFDDRIFFRCTDHADEENREWCSVEVDNKGNHVTKKGRWGHCDARTCSREKRTMTTNNCFTVSGATPDQPCVFPFTHNGRVYTRCTREQSDDNRDWCSTRVDATGTHILGQWEHCQCSEPVRTTTLASLVKPRIFPTRRMITRPPAATRPPATTRLPATTRPPVFRNTCPDTGPTPRQSVPERGTFLADLDSCVNSATSLRITGGRRAFVGEYPFVVLLGHFTDTLPDTKVRYTCGGSLINRRYVLTAAHCIGPERERMPVEVLVGEVNLEEDCDCNGLPFTPGRRCARPPQKIPVSSVVWHERYNRSNLGHFDIGLVRLRKPVQLSESVRLACLPMDEERTANMLNVPNLNEGLAGQLAFYAGFGRSTRLRNSNGVLAPTPYMLTVDVPVSDNLFCQMVFNNTNVDFAPNLMFCATSLGKSSCRGDSGGPIIFRSARGHQVQLGIVSLSNPRCGDGPSVNVRISTYTNWIRSNLQP